jgi:hypothetical protein
MNGGIAFDPAMTDRLGASLATDKVLICARAAFAASCRD